MLYDNSCTMNCDNSCDLRRVPRCMSCHKAIAVITRRTHHFHTYIYITPILLVWDLNTPCKANHLWQLIWRHVIYRNTNTMRKTMEIASVNKKLWENDKTEIVGNWKVIFIMINFFLSLFFLILRYINI